MRKAIISIFFILFWFCNIGLAQSVVDGLHNLSVSGSGTIKATSESEICIFCHTPHASSPQGALWNRNDPSVSYVLYNNLISSTFQATDGQPDGASVLCLSCHDGTIALGNVLSRTTNITIAGASSTMQGNSNISTDLSDDHPVSFIYNSTLATNDGQMLFPPTHPVVLDANSKLQCTSCHDPHNNTYDKFLVATKQYSELCFNCHERDYWSGSSHKSSTSTWNNEGTSPWEHIDTPYSTVAENACQNCHNPHNAGGNARLLKFEPEEDNCLDCHNGNVAATNIKLDFTQNYTHNVGAYEGIHDPLENSEPLLNHVECADCHNPHSVNSTTASAPNANGSIAGVRGIDQNGDEVDLIQYEYELCYRCHADNTVVLSSINRDIVQNNVREEFAISNPSYHPVSGAGQNLDVPSLILPLTESSIIYCTDCHASDASSNASGPHGSIYPNILKMRYETAEYTVESELAYELCYSCHNRTVILDVGTLGAHNHIDEKTTPCNTCHDPHGISSSQGDATNHSSLINFDTDIVTQNSVGQLEFVDTGESSGYCLLTCHGKNHRSGMKYPR